MAITIIEKHPIRIVYCDEGTTRCNESLQFRGKGIEGEILPSDPCCMLHNNGIGLERKRAQVITPDIQEEF